MITKKAIAIRAAKAVLQATQPGVPGKGKGKGKGKSGKGSHRQPCTHPDYWIRCVDLKTRNRRCRCGQAFPPLEHCDHPQSAIAVAKRTGLTLCQRCGAMLTEGKPADGYGDPVE